MPVARTGKRITLMASIAADGSVLKPQIIIPRKTVDVDLLLTGLIDEKVTIRSQPHGFVDILLFDLWFETTFLSEFAMRRTKYSYNGPAVLFLDQCSAHISQRFQELCPVNHVVPCYFPLHTFNQFQPLDLSLFGITKRLIARANKLDAVNIQTKHLSSVVCAFLSAAVPLNIVKTFAFSGIYLGTDAGTLFCTIRPDRAKRSLLPLPSAFPDISDVTDDDLDEDELKVFIEEYTDFIGPFKSGDDK
jgi:hypothetical protein